VRHNITSDLINSPNNERVAVNPCNSTQFSISIPEGITVGVRPIQLGAGSVHVLSIGGRARSERTLMCIKYMYLFMLLCVYVHLYIICTCVIN